MLDKLKTEIEAALSQADPAVELLLCELNGGTIRLFIDHPNGVDLELCERVTRGLRVIRESYGLEVSSPGPKRPLNTVEHFRRYVGRRAKIRTSCEYEGRRGFTGELVAADARSITVGADGALVSIRYEDIDKATLVPDATASKRQAATSGQKISRPRGRSSAPGRGITTEKTTE